MDRSTLTRGATRLEISVRWRCCLLSLLGGVSAAEPLPFPVSPITRGIVRLPQTIERLPEPSINAADGEAFPKEFPTGEELDQTKLTPEVAWWDAAIRQPLRPPATVTTIDLQNVLLRALRHSAQIRVLQETPQIRRTAIDEAAAEFDWTSFLESQWTDTSEPVGNRLTTGGPTRFRDEYLSASAGVRRRIRTGGRFEIAQEFGHQQNNSLFFDPPNQGSSRLTLNYTQPLLRGAGSEYNTSLTLLAEIDTAASCDEVASQLQVLLLNVTRAYWGLYLERGILLQRRRFYTEADVRTAGLEPSAGD